ncbi:mannose-6-phosphate isomerase [Multifurca ochricompacta]|uniref:Mannose-6-phosphate isomerase n=1 Tax=Multifurca ochricompacta TaxID=376703 RepID=A0AAD4M5L9_9AGAM|nr:mannose-6-phosphate isomerase [Multifurca ochricompacta]
MHVFKIVPTVQQYDWGKVGTSSKVALFAKSAGLTDFHVDESKPYAELWMGTHPKSPSIIPASGETLASYLSENRALIGEKVIQKFDADDGNLPFLFKVLAIEKALSIQSHPDKATAERLHAQQPDVYKDPNHKPEMALAITPFTALCGFLPLVDIATYLASVRELTALIPRAILDNFLALVPTGDLNAPAAKQALRDVFSAVMTAPTETFTTQLARLVERYRSGSVYAEEESVRELLSPGEAIFLGAGEPHAYISGDIIECMANSDNVIRAGLTPKLRDIPNLVATLTYAAAPASRHVVSPVPFPAAFASTLYNPPISEFSVVSVTLTHGQTETHRAIEGPSIAIITDGKGTIRWGGGSLDIVQGEVIFIGANTATDLLATGEKLELYRAFVEA